MNIVQANILDWARDYDGPLFHAALMDAPYEMEFMGKSWDNSGVAFDPETWRLIARCLYPGGYLFVMAGTLNDDLISVAMRQAGLRKFHKAMAWGYGSGFPKATRIDTQIDRRAGVERTKVGIRKHQPKFDAAGHGYRKKDNGYNSKARQSFDVTAPATELAAAWAGHRYGGQAIKPTVETILIFQKPYAGRPVDSIAATGAGALWIDGGRIGSGGQREWTAYRGGGYEGGFHDEGAGVGELVSSSAGRWPANLTICHHPACEPRGVRRVRGRAGDADYTPTGVQGPTSIVTNVKTGAHYGDEAVAAWACHPDCAVRRLGEQSGERPSGGGAGYRNHPDTIVKIQNSAPGFVDGIDPDTGTAARFFYQADWQAERMEAADQVGYFAKASKGEREAGLDPRQVALMRLIDGDGDDFEDVPAERADPGALRDGGRGPHYDNRFPEATVDDGRPTPIDNPYQRGETTRRNIHPTIKPIALTRWLATLLLPPDRYAPRRLLVPFAGAGSEMIGAMLAGWEEITGVELEADHVAIANARLTYWRQRRHKLGDPTRPLTVASAPDVPEGQTTLW